MTKVKRGAAKTDLDLLCDYSLQLNRWLLKPIGAWPKSSTTSKMERFVSLILIIISYSFILTAVIPCALHIFLEHEDIRLKIVAMGPLSHWSLGGVGYTTLLIHDKEIKWCVDQVKRDWQDATKPKVQQVMLKDAKFGRYVVAFCAAFLQGAILSFNMLKAFTIEIVQVGNETRFIRMLPLAAYKGLVPVDTNPANEIMLAVQIISGIIVNSSFVGAFSLATVFTAHVSGQLNVLMMWITEFVDQSRESEKRVDFKDIGDIVEKHLRIYSFISRIEAIMNEICFMELFKCTLSICLLGYYILMEWADQDFETMVCYALIFGSMSFNIFLLCFIGETITEQCNKVGETVYMSDWYHLPEKVVLDLMLILSRSYMETKITAGKIVHMSFYTFAGVMKTSAAYLNMLLQTI